MAAWLAFASLPCAAGDATTVPGDTDLTGLGWLPSDVFDVGEGLPDPTVTSIATLADGSVWMGTMRGLGRLHGGRVAPFPVPDGARGKAILDLAEDAENALWMAVDDGRVYCLQQGRWSERGAPFGSNRTQRLRVLGEGARARIFALGRGLAEWRGDRWHPRSLPPALQGRDVFDVAQPPATDGRPQPLWVATYGAGLYRCEDDGPCVPQPIGGPGPRSDEVRSLLFEARPGGAHALWLGLQGGGVARLADGTWTRWHTGNSALASDFVNALLVVADPVGGSELWAGTRSGLAVFRNGQWLAADPRTPQLHERIRSLALSRTSQGVPVVWSGSDNGAVRTRLGGPWRLVSTLGKGGNGVWGLRVERASSGRLRLWLGSDGEGLARFDEGRWRRFGTADGLPSMTIRSIARVPDDSPDGMLWVGTWGGHVARLRGDRFVVLPTPWPKRDDEAVSVLTAMRDDVWVSTRGQGIAHWNGSHWRWLQPGAGTPSRAYAALRHGRDIWFSTSDKGLARLRDGQWRFYGRRIGLPADAIYDMQLILDAAGRPVLWIGSNRSGLLRVDIGDPDHPRLLTQPSLPAMPVPLVYGAVRDGRGDLLVCTDYGVSSLRASAGGFTAIRYHRPDGLPHDECNANAMQVDDRGRVWIGTVGGAAVYTPPAAGPRKPSPLRLTGLRIDGRPVTPSATRLRMPRADSTLDLDFDLLTGESETGNRYRVTLAGAERGTWEADGKHRFSRLPAGRQHIRIEAHDMLGVVARPIELEIDVPQVWWRTPLARSLQVLAALLLFWMVLKLRERRLRQHRDRLRAQVDESTAQVRAREAELRGANDELRRLSYTDALTGLGNRRRLFEDLAAHCRTAAEQGSPLALMLLDLDHFKAFNDSRGHVAGDSLLHDVAQRMQGVLPSGAMASRYGGEEFCVLLPGLDLGAATTLAESLRQAIAGMDGGSGNGMPPVTASIGVAMAAAGDANCPDALLGRADRALYRAKASGRNRVAIADG